MTIALGVLLGIAVVLAITALTGYFVAQEFGYMAADRSELRARAASGDAAAGRALRITGRTSFMLSGAQLGITVTGLVVGYVAEPMIGEAVGDLVEDASVSTSVSLAVGTAIALLFATAVQMVFGELFPKNLAIARPIVVARRLAWSTEMYLKLLGWMIRVFDGASNRLLRLLRIEPVHDVEHAATSRDLEAIIGESRLRGDLTPRLSTVLDRVLDFSDRTARSAMVPRPQVATVPADEPLDALLQRMARGHSRYPVVGDTVDDVIGVVHLRDLLALPGGGSVRARDVARTPVIVPETLRLPEVVAELRRVRDEFACVLDEYGGLAGIITVEDIAEELVGEISDEHDPAASDPEPRQGPDGWELAGSLHLDEAERLLDVDLPRGPYQTLGGLVMARLGRLPQRGDRVELTIPAEVDTDSAPRVLVLTVRSVDRRVPDRIAAELS